MKKKRILIAGITVIVIAVIAVIGMRLLGGSSHTAIDNNPETEVSGDSKVLIAYFSWSGNGQQMARWISEETGGELFRIVPEESYGGSGFSNSISTIAELEPEAVVNEDGFTESRNNVQDAEPDIIAWLENLGYTK